MVHIKVIGFMDVSMKDCLRSRNQQRDQFLYIFVKLTKTCDDGVASKGQGAQHEQNKDGLITR